MGRTLLKRAKICLEGKILRVVSNVTRFLEVVECLGPVDPSLISLRHAFTQQWDTTCDWSWDVWRCIDSSGANDTERSAAVQRSITRACSVVHTLLDFVRVLNYKGVENWGEDKIRSFVLYYAGLDLEGSLLANLKYHTLWLSNRAKNVDPPVRGSTVRSVDGWLLDYPFQRFLSRAAKRRDWISETLLLGLKRGFPTMDLKSVDSELLGLKQDLGAMPPPLPQEMFEAIRRTAREIWSDDLLTKSDKREKPLFKVDRRFQFSPKAGYEREASIKKGGIRGVVFRWTVQQRMGYDEPQLGRMLWGPHCGQVIEQETLFEMRYDLVWEHLLSLWLADNALRRREGRPPRPTKCRVAVIFEPLKVRPITAGESLRYALGKPLQHALWKGLAAFDCFQLTASTVTPAAITRQMSKRFPWERPSRLVKCTEGEFDPGLVERWFQSGDFKAATNNLNSIATATVLQSVFNPESNAFDLATDLVGPHEVSYRLMSESTQGHGEAKGTFIQNQGQLMGSMISFPILCAVNAAVVRRSYERWMDQRQGLEPGTTRVSLQCLPLLINGDDILFRGDKLLFHQWSEDCKSVGFYESVGKSYVSKEWVQINSRTFDISFSVPGMAIATRQRAFLNFGVIEGFEKGVDPQDEPNLEQLSFRLGNFWSEFDHLPWGGVRTRAQQLAKERVTERLTHACKDGYIPYVPSLSNPTWAGGLGLFDAPFEVDAANEALCWKYVKPTMEQYRIGEVEGFWEKHFWKRLNDQDAFVEWHEKKVLERYRD